MHDNRVKRLHAASMATNGKSSQIYVHFIIYSSTLYGSCYFFAPYASDKLCRFSFVLSGYERRQNAEFFHLSLRVGARVFINCF